VALRDLLVKFLVQVDGEKKLESTDLAIRRTILSAERLGNTFSRLGSYLVVGTIARGIENFVEGMVQQAIQLKVNSDRLGLTSDELQKYTYVADTMGIKTEQVAVAMRYFNRTVGEAALGTKSAVKEFALLGINIKGTDGKIRPLGELVGEFSDKLAKMPDQATRTAHAMRVLGRGGSSVLPELQKGGAALKELFKDVDELGGGFNGKFLKQAEETNRQMKRLKFGWRSISVALATEVLPYFKRWVERGIETAKTLIDLAKKTYGFRTALMFLATGVALFALKLAQPFVALIALLTAAYLIFDDLYTFLEGGDSVIGRWLDKLGGSGTALQFWRDMKDAIAKVAEVFSGMGFSLKSIGESFASAIPLGIRLLGEALIRITTLLDHAITGFRILYRIASFGQAGTSIEELTESLQKRIDAYSKLGATFDELADPAAISRRAHLPGGSAFVGPTQDPNAAPPTQDPNAAPPTPIKVETTINISGAGDPSGVANKVSDKMKKLIADTVEEQRNRDTWNAVSAGGLVTGY
jgi:hypothetical protein